MCIRDRVRVGLRLEPGRLPNSALPPGTSIQLVPVAREAAAVPVGGSVAGVTASAPLLQTDGSTLIDVTVATTAGERVAQLAAAGQLSIIRLAPASR
jgi:Ethanolamine utilization protein EutJ (predicted chaperonin)